MPRESLAVPLTGAAGCPVPGQDENDPSPCTEVEETEGHESPAAVSNTHDHREGGISGDDKRSPNHDELDATRRAVGLEKLGEVYGVARRAHRFSSMRRTGVIIALPLKSIAPAAKTRAPAGVS